MMERNVKLIVMKRNQGNNILFAKTDSRTGILMRDKKEHYIMIEVPIIHEDIRIQISMHLKTEHQKMHELKEKKYTNLPLY